MCNTTNAVSIHAEEVTIGFLKESKIRVKSKGECRRFQELVFRLGGKWESGDTEPILLDSVYLYVDSELTLRRSSFSGEVFFKRHRYKEIEILWEAPSTHPSFNLEAALGGEPVRLRRGEKAYVRHHEEERYTTLRLFGYTYSPYMRRYIPLVWTADGKSRQDRVEHGDDIVGMWQESAKTKVINGHKVPDISFTPEEGEMYYIPDPCRPSLYDIRWFFSSDEYGVHYLKNNMCYPNTGEGREAAIAHAKALLNPKTCYDCFIDTFSDYVLGRGYGNLGQCIELAEDSYEGYNEDMPIPDYAEEVLNEIARGV